MLNTYSYTSQGFHNGSPITYVNIHLADSKLETRTLGVVVLEEQEFLEIADSA